MNEINFEIKDVEKMDFSMDIGIKEVLPPLENLEVNPTNEQQVFNHENSYGYDTVTVNPIEGDELVVTPTKEQQNFSGVYDEVTVNAIETEQLDVTPTKEEQSFSGIYGNVKVNAVTSEIDENIISDNIKLGVDILGVTGKLAGGKFAPKYVDFKNLKSEDLSTEIALLDTKYITSMNGMFQNNLIESANLSNWDFTTVENMSYMFAANPNLVSVIFGESSTPVLMSMNYMFRSNSKLQSLDMRNFDTSQVTSMSYMIAYCSELVSVDFSSFDTKKVTDMSYFAHRCYKIKRLDLKNFESPALVTFINAFAECSDLEYLDIRNMVLDKVKNISYLFDNCTKLMYLDIRSFDFSTITSKINTFRNMPSTCEIIVKDDTARNWILSRRSDFTNIKTVAELTE